MRRGRWDRQGRGLGSLPHPPPQEYASQHVNQVKNVMLTLAEGKVGGLLETNNEAWVQKMLESVKHGTLAVSVAKFLEHFEKAGKKVSIFFPYRVTGTTLTHKAENWRKISSTLQNEGRTERLEKRAPPQPVTPQGPIGPPWELPKDIYKLHNLTVLLLELEKNMPPNMLTK